MNILRIITTIGLVAGLSLAQANDAKKPAVKKGSKAPVPSAVPMRAPNAFVHAAVRKAPQIAPARLKALIDSAPHEIVLLDVRQIDASTKGPKIKKEDINLPRDVMEMSIYDRVPNRNVAIVVYSERGFSSSFAANTLAQMGYTNVRNLQGGVEAWSKAGLTAR